MNKYLFVVEYLEDHEKYYVVFLMQSNTIKKAKNEILDFFERSEGDALSYHLIKDWSYSRVEHLVEDETETGNLLAALTENELDDFLESIKNW